MVIFLGTALPLYRLFLGVERVRAAQLLTLASVSAGVGFLNTLNNLAALASFRGVEFLSVFDKPQRDALGMFFIRGIAFTCAQPALFGELAIMLWLVIRGAKPRLVPAAASA